MSAIVGPAAAKSALVDLIDEIRQSLAAAGGGDSAVYAQAVATAQARLRAFFKATEPADPANPAEVAAVSSIDDVAFDLFLELSLSAIASNNARLEAGAARLAALAGQLAGVSAETERAAASVALRPVKEALDSMTAIVASVKSLKANLSAADPDEAQVITEIDKLVAQFETLRNAVTGADA